MRDDRVERSVSWIFDGSWSQFTAVQSSLEARLLKYINFEVSCVWTRCTFVTNEMSLSRNYLQIEPTMDLDRWSNHSALTKALESCINSY